MSDGHRGPLVQLTRRTFVKAIGATAAAGLGGCWQPPTERVIPYVEQPPELVPGVPVSYATASVLEGLATGLLVQTREGRPIKVEGNPLHPASLGATSVFDQALLRDLYDSERVGEIGGRTGPRAWSAVLGRFRQAPRGGAGLALILEPTSSPFRAALLARLQDRYPGLRIAFHSALGAPPAFEAYRRTAGRLLVPRYDFAKARTVVALDADFVSRGPGHVRYAHDFAAGRRVESPADSMSRLFVAEPLPSGLSSLADHGLRVRAGDIVFLLGLLVRELGGRTDGLARAPDRLDAERVRAWVAAAGRDLRANAGAGVVVVGDTQPPAAHALAHEANRVIGAFGGPVVLQEPALARAGEIGAGLAALTDAMRAGDIDRLVVLDGDPVRTAPVDLEFGAALERVEDTLCLSARRSETTAACAWTVPALHPFETWGDARAFDGTLTPVQPLIRPLYPDARGVDDMLLALLGEGDTAAYEALRGHWKSAAMGLGPADAEAWEVWWDDALRNGVVANTAFAAVPPPEIDAAPLLAGVAVPGDGIEIAFRPDACLHDGRFASNPWLQELPDPNTRASWSNAALVSPALAGLLGVKTGDPVRVEVDGRSLEAPAFIVAGHADGAVTLSLGHGSEPVGRYRPLGVNAYPIRPAASPWIARGTVTATGGERWALPVMQTERHLHDRPILLRDTLDGYRADPDFTAEQRGAVPTWYGPPGIPPAANQWGMVIDLSLCTGCNACVVACRAENNIPVVGPEDVRKGRIMDWIRIDSYTTGPDEEPSEQLRQPMLCQHCEDAPCEYVCPTYATVHSDDGLNEMIYNRCVGTRFCSNNCPYKVRRFNWFDYNQRREQTTETLLLNPDVTVRDRGVMEKCTYCVQRIRRGEIRARREGRELGGDEIVTACQQACPTRAIVFGDIANPSSRVAGLRRSSRRFEVLHELGTRPRTQYLARISNPQPAPPPTTGAAADTGGSDG